MAKRTRGHRKDRPRNRRSRKHHMKTEMPHKETTMWTKYTEAISKGMTGPPEVGDQVLFRAKKGKDPIDYQGVVSRVLSPRKFMIKYKVPSEIKSLFIDGTSTAIASIDDMSFFHATVLYENEQKDGE